VVVLTTTPHYNVIDTELEKQPFTKKYFGLFYTSEFYGIKVYHVPLRKYKSTIKRLLSFIYWHIASLIIGLTIKNISFVLSTSPPLSIGVVSIIIGKLKRAKTIYNVQEIYPDLLINQGYLKSSFVINILRKIERFIYNNSNAVTTIDEMFYAKISGRFKNVDTLKIIPNFVDTEFYRPLDKDSLLHSDFSKITSRIKVLYAGNIGFFQDWEPVIYAAKELSIENIEFWIIGEGVQKTYLEKEVRENNLTNVRIFPYQRRELIPIINNYADIHFISINKQMEQEGFPSKVYTIMACAKPLIVITGQKTPLYNFLEGKKCAELVTSDRNVNFTNAIRKLASDEKLRKELGMNGYNEIINNYSKEVIVSNYANLLNSL
jgi:glycosyltransferase involved in cell wall biosynthesis